MSLSGYLNNGMNQSLNGILTITDGLGSTIENGKIVCTNLNANGSISATDISSNTINGINTANIPDITSSNIWTGTNTFNSNLPTSTQTPTTQYQLVNKNYVDVNFGGLGASNVWTGTNTFNTNLPTSTQTPTTQYQLVNKKYVDASFQLQTGMGSYVLTTTLTSTLSSYVLTTALTSTLSSYVLTTALNTALSSYVLTTALNTALSNYVTTTALNTALSNYVTTTALNLTLGNYITLSALTTAFADVPLKSVSNTFTGANTFTGGIFLDSTNLNTEILSFYSNTDIYGSAGVNLMTGGTTGWIGNTNSLSLSPTSCDIVSALTSGGSITGSNSIISPYIKNYNNVDPPSFPSTYVLDTIYFFTTFSQTTPSPAPTVQTSTTLYTDFTIPANYNKSISLSIPIACGTNAGSFTNSGTSAITITQTISNYNFLIFKDGVLSQTIAATKNATGILSSQVAITIPTPSSGFFSYNMFLANFSATFTPVFWDAAASYTIYFTSILTTTTSKAPVTVPVTAYTGTPFMRYKTSNFTNVIVTQTNCTITPMNGTGGTASTISTSYNANTTIGTTYVNNLTIANPPVLSYTVLSTSLTSNQIGYSVPVTYYTGTVVNSGSFVILAKTTVSLPIGNYNIYWTTALANTVGNGTISVGMYGIIFYPTATPPTSFSGSSYTEVHNQTAYNNQNQLYTSSAYVSPTTETYSVYLCVNLAFINTVMTTSSLSNLQVIRTS